VPADLVRPYPYLLGRKTTAAPHDYIEAIHRGPAIFFAKDLFAGVQPAWVLRRAEDIKAAYFDNEHFSVKDFSPFSQLLGQTWSLVPAEIDPPRHSLYRALVNPLFTPKRMALLDEQIRLYARSHIAAFKSRGACEFMSEFAFEFPIQVFLELMGLPQEQVALFLEWEHKLLHVADLAEITAGSRAVVDYLRAEIEDRRANPRDDFISFGVNAEVDGRKLNEDELVGFCFNLFIGGLDTVSTHMGMQFRHLAEHPADQATLRANPQSIPDAIDEFMRAYASVATFRTCIKETSIQGVKILPGDKLLLATFLAGRDPEAYDRPDEVILDRKPKHVSFGYGVHLCVGMHLARREMRIAMEQFLEMIPPFSIAPGAQITSYLAAMLQPVELPLVWDA
jgi:cytochrome P450